jgi:hypothetical protein
VCVCVCVCMCKHACVRAHVRACVCLSKNVIVQFVVSDATFACESQAEPKTEAYSKN